MSTSIIKTILFFVMINTYVFGNNEGPYKNRNKMLFKSSSNCKLEENKCLLPGSTDNKAECINVEFPVTKKSDGMCEIDNDYCYIVSIKKSRKLNIESNGNISDLEKFKNFYCSCKPVKSNSKSKNRRCFYEDINSCYDYSEGEITNNLSMKKICGLNGNSNPNCVDIEYENFKKTFDFRLTYFKDLEKEEYYKFSPIGNSIEIPEEKLSFDNLDICHCPEYFMCYERVTRNVCSPTVYEKIKPMDKNSNREYELIMHFPNRDGLYCLNVCNNNYCYDDFNTHTCIPLTSQLMPSSDTHGFCKCIDDNKCIEHESMTCIQPRDFMDNPSRLCQCVAIDNCYRHDNYECVTFDANSIRPDILNCICPDEKPCINYPNTIDVGDVSKGIFPKFDSAANCTKVKKGFKAVGNNRDCIPITDENGKTDL